MNDAAPAYEVIGVQDTTDYMPMRGTVRAKRVDYKLSDGTQSYVVLPLDSYTKEAVQTALHAAAERHAEILSIQGPPHRKGQPIPPPHPWSGGS